MDKLNIKRTESEIGLYKSWCNSNSIYESLRIANRYLSSRIRNMQTLIAQDFPEDISEIELEEIIADLVEDLCLAQTQLKLDYPAVAEYAKY